MTDTPFGPPEPLFFRRLFLVLLLVIALLIGLSQLTQDFPTLHSRFDVDAEGTVPAWYSSQLLFCVALCSVGLYFLRRSLAPRDRAAYFWLIFAAAFLFFSADETAQFHEALEIRLHKKWIFIYAPLAAVFMAGCLFYLARVETDVRVRNWVLGGLVIYGLGALGMEAWTYFFYSAGTEQAEVYVEESLEMAGTSMVLVGVLHGVAGSWRQLCAQSRPA